MEVRAGEEASRRASANQRSRYPGAIALWVVFWVLAAIWLSTQQEVMRYAAKIKVAGKTALPG